MPKADEFFGLGKMIEEWVGESARRQYIAAAAIYVIVVIVALLITAAIYRNGE